MKAVRNLFKSLKQHIFMYRLNTHSRTRTHTHTVKTGRRYVVGNIMGQNNIITKERLILMRFLLSLGRDSSITISTQLNTFRKEIRN